MGEGPTGVSNEIRETGEVVREDETEGFLGVRNEGNNEQLEDKSGLGLEYNKPELEDKNDEVVEVEGGLEGIAEVVEGNGNEFGDNDEEVECNPNEV